MIEQLPTIIKCKNCSADIEHSYCPVCGQKKAENRLTFKYILQEFVHNYLGSDNGFWYTTQRLFLRPGHTVNEYLDGRRKPYLKPLQYYLIGLTLYFIVTSVLHINPMDMGQTVSSDLGMADTIESSSKAKKTLAQLNAIFNENLKVIFTLLIFISALAIKLAYWKSRYNFTEMIILNLYVYGISFLLYSAQTVLYTLPFTVIATKIISYTIYILSMGYAVYAFYQFYPKRGMLPLLKAVWAYILGIIIYLIFTAIMSGLFMKFYV
jgi:hypothetical protein